MPRGVVKQADTDDWKAFVHNRIHLWFIETAKGAPKGIGFPSDSKKRYGLKRSRLSTEN